MSQHGWGWGPVFEAERVTRARRWQGYAIRSLFVLPLLVVLGWAWLEPTYRFAYELPTSAALAAIGATFCRGYTGIVLTVVLLIAPATMAGAICGDRSRGILDHLFLTDLTNREIVLGKLAARLFPIWGLLGSTLPVMAMATWLGGIDPRALTALFLVALALAWLGCTLALMLSVWADQPRDVLTVVYATWAVWLLAGPVYQFLYLIMAPTTPVWIRYSNPFTIAFRAGNHPGAVSLVESVVFAVGSGVIGGVCVLIAVARVRVAPRRSAAVGSRRVRGGLAWIKRWKRLREPKLDANPILWREWRQGRLSGWSRPVWVGYAMLSAVVGVGLVVLALQPPGTPAIPERIGLGLGLLTSLGLLLLSTRTASVLADERASGSIDVLLTTPLSTRSILRAKWRGSFRRVPWLAFWPAVVGLVCAANPEIRPIQLAIIAGVVGLIVVQGAFLVSLGLALATWIKRSDHALTAMVAFLVILMVGWPALSNVAALLLTLCLIPVCLGMALIAERRKRPVLAKALAIFALGLVGGLILFIFFNLSVSSLVPERVGYVIREYLVAMGSPIVNIALPLIHSFATQRSTTQPPEGFLILVGLWIGLYALAAWLLFEATVRTFDRCLGRMPAGSKLVRLKNAGRVPPPSAGRADADEAYRSTAAIPTTFTPTG